MNLHPNDPRRIVLENLQDIYYSGVIEPELISERTGHHQRAGLRYADDQLELILWSIDGQFTEQAGEWQINVNRRPLGYTEVFRAYAEDPTYSIYRSCPQVRIDKYCPAIWQEQLYLLRNRLCSFIRPNDPSRVTQRLIDDIVTSGRPDVMFEDGRRRDAFASNYLYLKVQHQGDDRHRYMVNSGGYQAFVLDKFTTRSWDELPQDRCYAALQPPIPGSWQDNLLRIANEHNDYQPIAAS